VKIVDYRTVEYIESNFLEEEVEMGFQFCSLYKMQQMWNIHFTGIYEVSEVDELKCRKIFKLIKEYYGML
jgi:hypothetical protein